MNLQDITTYIQGLVTANATIPAKDALIAQLQAQVKALTPVVKTVPLTSLSGISNQTINITPATYNGKYILSNLQNVIINLATAKLQSLTRMFEIKGSIKNVVINGCYISDTVNDYFIAAQDKDAVIDGLRLTGFTCENTMQFFHADYLVKNVEIDNNVFKNSPVLSSAVEIANGWNVLIHDNTVNNVNTKNSNHNGIFVLKGSGKMYNNTVTNHQGNGVRSWPYGHGDATESVEIYGNNVSNSTRYGAIEVQADKNLPAGFIPIPVSIHDNVAANLGTVHDYNYSALMVDLYPTGASVEIYNNKGENLYTTDEKYHPIDDNMINDEGGKINAHMYGNFYKR